MRKSNLPGSNRSDKAGDGHAKNKSDPLGKLSSQNSSGRLSGMSAGELGHHQLDNLEEEDEEEDDEDNGIQVDGVQRNSQRCGGGADGGNNLQSVSSPRLPPAAMPGTSMSAKEKKIRGNLQFKSTRANDNKIEEEKVDNSSGSSEEDEEQLEIGLLRDDDVIEYLDDQFSVGLPSDIPSGIVDIEGNLLVDLKIGEEEDDDYEDDEERIHQVRDDGCYPGGRGRGRYSDQGQGGGGGVRNSGNYSQKNHNPLLSNAPSLEDDQFDVNDPRFSSGEGRIEPIRRLSVISNGKVFTHGRGYHLHNHPNDRRLVGIMGRDNSTSAQSTASSSTIQQHYYPEGGWGWIILFSAVFSHVLMCGINLCAGLIIWAIVGRFGPEDIVNQVKKDAGWFGACSVGVSLLFSPIWVSICKRKSTRLTAVFGGLVAALGCLFTSFATQLHQVFFSYATILGIGVGLTRDASSLMVGQYFRKKRDFVEMIVVAASGLGILLMSLLINNAISTLGWRLGLQAVTGCLFFCFFLGTCYRSASLYHPQRRAILHLKNQKRKIKEKEKRHDGPPFLDCTCLKSKTVQILLLSSAFAAFGIYTPLFYLATDFEENAQGFDHLTMSLMYIYVGAAWIAGCVIFGLLVVQQSKDCRVSKQYLCQVAGIVCGISIGTYTIVQGQSGLIIFSCIYGFSLGGYHYALKVYTFERVRTRHFPRAWSFIQSSQALPLFFGVPLTGYLNEAFPGWRAGYYLSSATVFLGSLCLFLTDVRKRRMSRRKSANSSTKTCETVHTNMSASRTTSTTLSISMDKNSASSSKFNRVSFPTSTTDIGGKGSRGLSSDTSGFDSAPPNTDNS